MTNRLVLIIACFAGLPGLAQDATIKPSWVPKTLPAPNTFDFANLSIARMSADKKKVQFARPNMKMETHQRTISKTILQKETRLRNTTVKGEPKTETIEVEVPVNVEETQQYCVRIPDGSVKFEVAIDRVSAMDLNGNPIDGTTLAQRLQNPAYVLASEADPKSFTPIDPYYLNVLRPETIVIYLPQRSIPAPKPPEAPTSSVPALPAPAADLPSLR